VPIYAEDHNCDTCRHEDVNSYDDPCADCIPWINTTPHGDDNGMRCEWEPVTEPEEG
jgi:hypothetical protein